VTSIGPVARERRPTLYFLRQIRAFSPVFLDTEVDMSAVLADQAAARARGERVSVICYVIYVAGRVLLGHPEANAAILGRAFPRVARFGATHCKVTFDKRLGGRRVVVSAVVTSVQARSLPAIQADIATFRDSDPARMPELAGARLLQRLPWPVGLWLFWLGVRPLRRRAATMGTFAVTSLSHRPVDGFASVGGTTVTLGLGQVTPRPIVRDGAVTVAPTMRLTLTFDHRVIDGAEAADVLAEIKAGLEAFTGETPGAAGSPAAAIREDTR
jgi:pyruvate/2-oxoglutarate dehydrogenase complex dihydrolipoamide acyltransferase (E2) component